MRLSDMLYQLISVFFAAISTIVAGLVLQYITRKRSSEKKESQAEANKLAEMVRNEADIRRSNVIEALIQKLPEGPQSIESLTGALHKLASEVPRASGEKSEDFLAVEGLIASYHEQALSQARIQFWFSVAAATVGFAWLLITGSGIDSQQLGTVLKTLPGVVMDVVAFLFFKQASETRQRATDLYDRLRTDKQSSEAIDLVASIADLKIRSAVQAQIALHKAGLAPTPIDIMRFLGHEFVKNDPAQG